MPGESVGVLFDGSRMLSFKMFGKDEELKKVTIRAQAPDGPLSVTIDVTPDCHLESGKFLHQLAARRKIQEIEESVLYAGSTEQKAEMKGLALKYGIASKYTSFVGVDKNTRKDLAESSMKVRQIHQEVPEGYGAGMAFGGGGPMLFMGRSVPMSFGAAPPPMMAACSAMPVMKSKRSQHQQLRGGGCKFKFTIFQSIMPIKVHYFASFLSLKNNLGSLCLTIIFFIPFF